MLPFKASPKQIQSKSKARLLGVQHSSSRLGSERGSPSLWSCGKAGLKIPRSREKGTLRESHFKPSLSDHALSQVQHWIGNAEIQVHLIPSSAHTQLHVSPPSPAYCSSRIRDFNPSRGGPQGSSTLRGILGFIQPPCSNVSRRKAQSLRPTPSPGSSSS